MSNRKYYCAYCGQFFKSVSELTRAGLCARHPDGPVRGKHKLYEGAEKTVYTCKYCGMEARTIDRLTSSPPAYTIPRATTAAIMSQHYSVFDFYTPLYITA